MSVRFNKKYNFNVVDLAAITGETQGKLTKIENKYVDMKALAALEGGKPVYRIGDKNDVSVPAVYDAVNPGPGPEPTAIKAVKFSMVNSAETNTLSLTNEGGNAPSLEYSLDEGETWNVWDYSAITFGNGVDVYVRGNNPSGFSFKDSYSYFAFGDNDKMVNVSGNIMYLIDYTQELTVLPNDGCFKCLFKNCEALENANELNLAATTLTERCYWDMFLDCTKLKTAPALPAMILATGCYDDMFDDCYLLETAPALPATTLAEECYNSMFYACESLTEAPVLPATTLADWCYSYMLQDCTGLTQAPDLPATTLTESCYYDMFAGCTSLNSVNCLATDISADYCLSDWLSGAAATGTVYCAAGMKEAFEASGEIPEGWTVVEG